MMIGPITTENPMVRMAVVIAVFLLIGCFGFALGYLARGDVNPAPITIEKCSQ